MRRTYIDGCPLIRTRISGYRNVASKMSSLRDEAPSWPQLVCDTRAQRFASPLRKAFGDGTTSLVLMIAEGLRSAKRLTDGR